LFIIPDQIVEKILSFQLGPSVIHLTAGWTGITFTGIIILLFVVLVPGRVYCSTICPLGFIQDVVIWLGKFFDIRSVWEIEKKNLLKIIRISLLAITVILLISGNVFFAGFFEPFALFSRMLF
jgi:polyferredoxin